VAPARPQAYQNERNAPEILQYQEPLVARVESLIADRVRHVAVPMSYDMLQTLVSVTMASSWGGRRRRASWCGTSRTASAASSSA